MNKTSSVTVEEAIKMVESHNEKIWNNNTPIELGVTDPGELGFALSIVIATVKEYNGISGMYDIGPESFPDTGNVTNLRKFWKVSSK